MKHDTFQDLAIDYAAMFQLEPQRPEESGAAFRERVARTLDAQGEKISAHEVLYNRRLGEDLFAHGSLDRGHGAEFVTKMAMIIQSVSEEEHKLRAMPSWKQKLYTVLR